MLKRFLFICLCAFAVCTASFSLAEAADITAECLLYGADKQVIHCLHDGDYQTSWPGGAVVYRRAGGIDHRERVPQVF